MGQRGTFTNREIFGFFLNWHCMDELLYLESSHCQKIVYAHLPVCKHILYDASDTLVVNFVLHKIRVSEYL